MESNAKSVVLSVAEKTKSKKVHKFRDTVLVRLSRGFRDEVRKESKRTKESISQIMDWATEEYLKSVKPLS